MTLLTAEEKSSLSARIEKIINTSNLEDLTVKSIRQTLEQQDSKDYTPEKSFFSQEIKTFLEARHEREGEHQQQQQNIKTNNIKKQQKQKPQSLTKNESVSELDDFKVALQLQKEEESFGSRSLRKRGPQSSRKYAETINFSSKSKVKSSNDNIDGITGEVSSVSRGRPFNKPLLMSPALSALFDDKYQELTRPDVTKKIWEYIKANNLQDPKDKRFFISDERLMNVFNRPRIHCFKLAKYLSSHLHRKDEVVNSSQESIAVAIPKTTAVKSNKTLTTRTPLPVPAAAVSNKKIKSCAKIEDSDEEVESNANSNTMAMNPLLLQIPGVSAAMPYNSVQAAILAYTQAEKLRDPSNPDSIIIKANSPLFKLMNVKKECTIHILDLISRVRELFEGQMTDNK